MKEFGNDFVFLSDNEGGRYVLEHLYNFEYQGSEYAVFLPAGEEAEQDQEMIVLRVVYEGTDVEYENIPEAIYEDVMAAFEETLFDECE